MSDLFPGEVLSMLLKGWNSNLSQELSAFFRENSIDVHTASDFKACGLRNPWDYGEIPVKIIRGFILDGNRTDGIVIIRIV